MPSVKIALATGLALILAGLGATLAHSPMSVARSNLPDGVLAPTIAFNDANARYCQENETLPARTTVIRVALRASIGPRVALTATSAGHTVASGTQPAGWTGAVVSIPVGPLARTLHGVTVCLSFRAHDEWLTLHGQPVRGLSASYDGQGALPGSMGLEYLRAGTRTWAALIPDVVRNMALGRAFEGRAIVYLALALALVVVLLVVRLLLSASCASHRTVAWTCALVAALNAACWSILTPPFQVPDEPDHVAYVKQLAETRGLPSSDSEKFSIEELDVLEGLRHDQVTQHPQNHTIATTRERDQLRRDLALASRASRSGSPAAGVAASQPPLYYALEAIPYELAWGATLLVRLQLMRLLSALFAGATAMFVYLFLREALPARPWAWTIGTLAVALVPLLAFMSGAVNPDALLFAVSAASFYALARAFRRGLSARGVLAIGVVTAVGLLTKLNFIGLIPGIALGVVLLARRARGRSGLRSAALCAAPPLILVAAYAAANALSGKPLLGFVSSAAGSVHGSLLAEANYIWQLYLPPIPGTVVDFPGLFTARQLWFHGYVGLFGWFDTTFPGWVYTLALLPAGAIALLCARALAVQREALHARAGELAVYATMALGLLALIGADSYSLFPMFTATYAQARYLLPLLPLLGAILALAARGAGSRWGPAAGTLIVVLFLAHNLFSQLLLIGRYYG